MFSVQQRWAAVAARRAQLHEHFPGKESIWLQPVPTDLRSANPDALFLASVDHAATFLVDGTHQIASDAAVAEFLRKRAEEAEKAEQAEMKKKYNLPAEVIVALMALAPNAARVVSEHGGGERKHAGKEAKQ